MVRSAKLGPIFTFRHDVFLEWLSAVEIFLHKAVSAALATVRHFGLRLGSWVNLLPLDIRIASVYQLLAALKRSATISAIKMVVGLIATEGVSGMIEASAT